MSFYVAKNDTEFDGMMSAETLMKSSPDYYRPRFEALKDLRAVDDGTIHKGNEFRRVATGSESARYGMMPTFYPIPNNRHTGDKKTRIRRLTNFLAKRRFRFRDTEGGRLLVRQFQEFPVGDHDDGPDAVEMAIRLMRNLQAKRKKST